MFEIKNVTKRFGDEYALNNISMNIGKGLSFIIGASGSGKTTLLKILTGMEQDFEGEVYYNNQNIKALTDQEKSYYYNNVFGFVWQDFNLLDQLTVIENVMLPQYLKAGQDKKAVMKVLSQLKISELANQKVGELSGGQKQRVAIARELLKNPQVIIADEPTSALDEQAAKITMDILRDIAKTRAVIVVTHDTLLINEKSKVYELDKGELISSPDLSLTKPVIKQEKNVVSLKINNGIKLAINSIKSKIGRSLTTAISLVVAASLLLVTVSGVITDSGKDTFQTLLNTYGESILDIDVVGSFMSAGGTDGQENNKPNANVDQNIDGLYEKYSKDERVNHILYSQAYNDIKVTIDDKTYKVESTGSTPVANKLVSGEMPMGDENEVAIPESFLKKLGLSAKEAIGKTIDFSGTIYNWDSGEPVEAPVSITAKIVGIIDTTVKYEYDGQLMEYSVDDAFFFSKNAVDTLRKQANVSKNEGNFTIRAKTPQDMIAIKNELNAMGIVPLGRFELLEDIVNLNNQTAQQSGSAVLVIGFLAIISVLAVAGVTSFSRKREYAIFKVSGYGKKQLLTFTICESIVLILGSSLLFVCLSPAINFATTLVWGINILKANLLLTGLGLIVLTGVLSGFITGIVAASTPAAASLKTGER